MFRTRWILLFLLLSQVAMSQDRKALVLSQVVLYADSVFSSEVIGPLASNQLLTVQGQSKLLHYDNNQTQLFYWYLVEDDAGQRGWVLGDGLAILHESPETYAGIRLTTDGYYRFCKNFEKSLLFWGDTQGKDEVSSHFSETNEFRENYLVFLTEDDRVARLPVGTISERGQNRITELTFLDVTDDGYDEVVLIRSISGRELAEDVRVFEIYSYLGDYFKLIYEQKINLAFAEGIASPARFKLVEMNSNQIRFEYPVYGDCTPTHFGVQIDTNNATYNKCLSLVTETFVWDEVANEFTVFYEASNLPVKGSIQSDIAFLRSEPTSLSESKSTLPQGESFKIMSHVETILSFKGRKATRVFFFIKLNDGRTGYVRSKDVTIDRIKHRTLLNAFYQSPMLIKSDWKEEMPFLYNNSLREKKMSSNR